MERERVVRTMEKKRRPDCFKKWRDRAKKVKTRSLLSDKKENKKNKFRRP